MQLLFLLTHGTMILILRRVHNWYKRVHKLAFPLERRQEKVKAKQKVRARADILFDTSVVGGPSTTVERTEGKNRMSCLWSKGTLGT